MNAILPKISVIVPVYNVENYVSKCLDSIIGQTYKNLEIIVVNDGSTDNSGHICEDYAKRDERITLIHQNNQGLSMARNNALDVASGEYMGFVDSDDWIAPDMFFALYDNAAAHEADISMCNFYYVSASGELSPYSSESAETKILDGIYKIAHNIRLSNNCVWNRIYRRHLFDDIRFPKGKAFEDIFVMHKLVDRANKVVLSPECKYYYLRREDGITLKKFNLGQMGNLEAYMERHEYISGKYPALEKTCRKHIFQSLLWLMRKASRDNMLGTYKEALAEYINAVKHYEFSDCGLSAESIQLLKLLFEDIGLYAEQMQIILKGAGEANG